MDEGWCSAYHMRGQHGLEVEEHSDGSDLLQPLLADLLALLLVLPAVVVAEVERGEQLFRQGADCAHQTLTENPVPTQLQVCV